MTRITAFLRREPALVAAVLNGAIAAAAAHGLHLSPADEALVFLGSSLLLGVAVRQQVTPVSPGP